MRVLVVTPWFPTVQAPATHLFVRDHARASADVHDVHVLHLDWNGAWRERPDAPDPVTRLPVPGRGPLGFAASFLILAIGLVWILLRHGFVPHAVHGHVFKVAPHAWLASRLFRCSWVHTEHWTGFERRRATPAQLAMTRWSYRRADRVLPVSKHLQQVLIGQGIVASYHVVWNAVDTDAFAAGEVAPTQGPVRLLTIGMDPEDNKNIDGILRAYAALPGAGWSATIVGEATAREAHEYLACELGIDDRVEFVGRARRSEVAELLASHDVLVHASRVETFSIAVGEALCSGVPVVAHDTGAIREMVEIAQGGRVVEDLTTLAGEIRRMINIARSYEKGAVASRIRPTLALDRLARDLDHVYRNVG